MFRPVQAGMIGLEIVYSKEKKSQKFRNAQSNFDFHLDFFGILISTSSTIQIFQKISKFLEFFKKMQSTLGILQSLDFLFLPQFITIKTPKNTMKVERKRQRDCVKKKS